MNDSRREVNEARITRDELRLPAQAFVFCCFNASYKISPLIFASWMRILQRVPGSVLFLLKENDTVMANLRKEAAAHGVEAQRLVFGPRLPVALYLARYQSCDLFLDTLPYNAGTTASDALWAGLPVMTCRGDTFAGRVGASLLSAAGLPELIATDLTQYEELAVEFGAASRAPGEDQTTAGAAPLEHAVVRYAALHPPSRGGLYRHLRAISGGSAARDDVTLAQEEK